MRLLLIRHGPSAHLRSGRLLDREGVQRWRAAYDEAGVLADDRPPAWLADEVSRASVVAASDLLRATDSAARLAPGRPVMVSPLFREIPLPVPRWLPGRAPLLVWDALIHVAWGLDLLRGQGMPFDARERAREAVRWCRDACRQASGDGATVAVVTHGAFRRVLAQQLLREGWRAGAGRRSYAHWSVWRFDAAAALAASAHESTPMEDTA